MGTRRKPVGREVPIPGSDSFTWIEIIVPPSSVPTKASTSKSPAPPTEDRAWCFHEDRSCLFPIHVCRINKSSPHVLEVLELVIDEEFPSNGLRIVFPEALFPFAFMWHEAYRYRNPFTLEAVTLSGSAYVIHLKSADSYTRSSILRPNNEVFEFDVRPSLTQGVITSVAATRWNDLVVGTSLGSVTIFQLYPGRSGSVNGYKHGDYHGFRHELRHKPVTRKWWNFGSNPKKKMVAAVQDLGIAKFHAFVLHSDGTVRVWHLSDHNKLLSYKLRKPSSEGTVFKRLWVFPRYGTIHFAILHKWKLEDTNMQTISIYSAWYGDFGSSMWMNSAVLNISFEGECLDVCFSERHIVILKDNGLVSYDIDRERAKVLGDPKSYALHEEFVADQVFQSFERFPDDLLWMTESILASTKGNSIPLVASILLRKLLYPGISDECDQHLLTVDGLTKELVSLIEQEVCQGPLLSSFRWKDFCKRYFEHWSKKNAPLALAGFGPDGCAIFLIRKSSVAVFRLMNKIERLSVGEVSHIENIGLSASTDKDGREILVQVLRCVNRVSQRLGKTASAVIYELLTGTSMMKCDDFFPCLRRLLRTECSSPAEEFSACMLSSLQNMRDRAVTWARVLDVVEGYVNLLVPNKTRHKFGTTSSLDKKTSIIALSTSQIARAMFESAIHVLLFLGFVLDIGGKIHLSGDDSSRIQLELVPRLQTVIAEWLTIDFFTSAPLESPAVKDLSRQVSSSKMNGSTNKILCKDQLGNGNSESVLLSNCPKLRYWSSDLPERILEAAGELISRIIWGRTGDGSSTSTSHTAELATILIRNQRYNLAELLIGSTKSLPRKQYHSRSSQDAEAERCMLKAEHLLAEARTSHGTPKDAKVLPKATASPAF